MRVKSISDTGEIVALRKESVDRNLSEIEAAGYYGMSLSARRAWIEILAAGRKAVEKGVALRKESVDRNAYMDSMPQTATVALRKESVDRNSILAGICTFYLESLSARRAWIEMPFCRQIYRRELVALRKESVDRNFGRSRPQRPSRGRSPQGERG